MTNQEKQELARWLAEKLAPDMTGPLWFADFYGKPAHIEKVMEPAPLDGNFAAAVIAAMNPEWDFESRAYQYEENVARFWKSGGEAEGEGIHADIAVAVCLAAKAALEGEEEVDQLEQEEGS